MVTTLQGSTYQLSHGIPDYSLQFSVDKHLKWKINNHMNNREAYMRVIIKNELKERF
jgi:hypothetical protein